jgi:hypothetical protein
MLAREFDSTPGKKTELTVSRFSATQRAGGGHDRVPAEYGH